MDLSTDVKRLKQYHSFLNQEQRTLNDIIQLGHRMMRRARLHPHFLGNNKLIENAQYLAFHALQLPYDFKNPTYLNRRLTVNEAQEILTLFETRIAKRLPVEYITQSATYSGRQFFVNEHVLVPRSLMNMRFHEFLAETQWSNHRVLDLCAGSGCIGITLALMNPKLHVDLADISAAALNVAAINIGKHNLENRVRCIQTDLFANITEQYDLIITNPPYVSTGEYRRISREFKNEPKLALECGNDGLDIVKKTLSQARDYLTPNGKIIAEVGFPAAKRLKIHYSQHAFRWYPYRKPSGKTPWLAMDCVFECQAKDLPPKRESNPLNKLLRRIWS